MPTPPVREQYAIEEPIVSPVTNTFDIKSSCSANIVEEMVINYVVDQVLGDRQQTCRPCCGKVRGLTPHFAIITERR
ncbi:MAG: hypothetical protein WBL95_08420 [Microcoleus sp.]